MMNGSASSGLIPQTPDDCVALYRLIHDELDRLIVGHAETKRRLSLIGVRHLARDRVPTNLLRVLLIGEPDVAPASIAVVLAKALGLPFVRISANTMAELNWSGTDLGDYLGALYNQVPGSQSSPAAAAVVERAVVVIDEVCRLRLPGEYAAASTRDYQLGRQHSLLPIVGNGIVPIERPKQDSLYWPSTNALVICCGQFDGLLSATPGPGDLAAWGLVPELAERLGSGLIIRLPPLNMHEAAQVLSLRTRPFAAAFKMFGFNLEVSDEVLTYMAEQICSGDRGLGLESGIACLSDSAERALIRLVDERAMPNSWYVLSPDDINLPPKPKPLWRE